MLLRVSRMFTRPSSTTPLIPSTQLSVRHLESCGSEPTQCGRNTSCRTNICTIEDLVIFYKVFSAITKLFLCTLLFFSRLAQLLICFYKYLFVCFEIQAKDSVVKSQIWILFLVLNPLTSLFFHQSIYCVDEINNLQMNWCTCSVLARILCMNN